MKFIRLRSFLFVFSTSDIYLITSDRREADRKLDSLKRKESFRKYKVCRVEDYATELNNMIRVDYENEF